MIPLVCQLPTGVLLDILASDLLWWVRLCSADGACHLYHLTSPYARVYRAPNEVDRVAVVAACYSWLRACVATAANIVGKDDGVAGPTGLCTHCPREPGCWPVRDPHRKSLTTTICCYGLEYLLDSW